MLLLTGAVPHGLILGICVAAWHMFGEIRSLKTRCQAAEGKLEQLCDKQRHQGCPHHDSESLARIIMEVRQQRDKMSEELETVRASRSAFQEDLQAVQGGASKAAVDRRSMEQDLVSTLELAQVVIGRSEQCQMELDDHQLNVENAAARSAEAEQAVSGIMEGLKDGKLEVHRLQAELQTRRSEVEKSAADLHLTEQTLSITSLQLTDEKVKMAHFNSELQEHCAAIQQAQHSVSSQIRAEIACVSKGLSEMRCDEPSNFKVGDVVRARDGPGSYCSEWSRGVITSVSPLMVNRQNTGYALPYEFVEHDDQQPSQQRLLRLCSQQAMKAQELENTAASAREQMVKATGELGAARAQTGLLQDDLLTLRDRTDDLDKDWRNVKGDLMSALEVAEAGIACAARCQSNLIDHELSVGRAISRSAEVQQAVSEMVSELDTGKAEVQQLRGELQTQKNSAEQSMSGLRATEQALSATNLQLELEQVTMAQFDSEVQECMASIQQTQYNFSENIRPKMTSVSNRLSGSVEPTQHRLLTLYEQQSTKLQQLEGTAAIARQQMSEMSQVLLSAREKSALLQDDLQMMQDGTGDLQNNLQSTEEALMSALEMTEFGIDRTEIHQSELEDAEMDAWIGVSQSTEALLCNPLKILNYDQNQNRI